MKIQVKTMSFVRFFAWRGMIFKMKRFIVTLLLAVTLLLLGMVSVACNWSKTVDPEILDNFLEGYIEYSQKKPPTVDPDDPSMEKLANLLESFKKIWRKEESSTGSSTFDPNSIQSVVEANPFNGPEYNQSGWDTVLGNSNCYAYALDLMGFWPSEVIGNQTMIFPLNGITPGDIYEKAFLFAPDLRELYTPEGIIKLIKDDMLALRWVFMPLQDYLNEYVDTSSTLSATLVAIGLDLDNPEGKDCHFIRLDVDGCWSHKQGNGMEGPVQHGYAYGLESWQYAATINDPQVALEEMGYEVFVGYYVIVKE
ncbi:MAG: hypothetical protein LBB91_11400 [Clostridiales bacterium]|jgi:hypothetical protein|nr:hypothetical protein [Clostridiales bacterium]